MDEDDVLRGQCTVMSGTRYRDCVVGEMFNLKNALMDISQRILSLIGFPGFDLGSAGFGNEHGRIGQSR
jgi:hypothetical protein